MSIFYLDEHTPCHYYNKTGENSFKYFEAKAGDSYNGKINNHYIVFLLKGSVNLSCNEFEMKLSSGEMLFIHRNTLLKYLTLEESEFVIAVFENVTNLCTKTALSQLLDAKKTVKYEIKPFIIKDRLLIFLEPLAIYLKDGAKCSQLHDIKLQELFWVFRAYYSKEELASFLYTIIGISHNFRDKVLNNYTHATTVQELADRCGISLGSFKKQFAAEFGEAPYSWMQKRMVSVIKYRLADNDLPLKHIIDELHFSSLPQLVRFCKKYLGQTPGEIRKQMKSRNSDNQDIEGSQ